MGYGISATKPIVVEVIHLTFPDHLGEGFHMKGMGEEVEGPDALQTVADLLQNCQIPRQGGRVAREIEDLFSLEGSQVRHQSFGP